MLSVDMLDSEIVRKIHAIYAEQYTYALGGIRNKNLFEKMVFELGDQTGSPSDKKNEG